MQARAPAHDQDGQAHGKALCQNGCAACCPGFAAALPHVAPPAAVVSAASWQRLDPAPRLNARAAEIFKPPRASS
jgi:hypothetical protein